MILWVETRRQLKRNTIWHFALTFNPVQSFLNNEVWIVNITSGCTRIGSRVGRVPAHIKLGTSGADSLVIQME